MSQENEEAFFAYQSDSSDQHYLFVDLETGGLYPKQHSILQIAAVLTDLDFKIQGYFMSYLKPHPELEVTEYALSINQLKWEDLQDAPHESYVALALQQFALLRGQKGRFAGYNCQFDLEFLSLMWQRQNNIATPYTVPWLDIYSCVKSKISPTAGLVNFKLASVASYFGISAGGAHDALQDLFMTIEIAKILKEMPDLEDKTSELQTAKFSVQQKRLAVEAKRQEILNIKIAPELSI